MGDAIELIHGTAVALDGRAALFRGVSGSGKSDLALRCLGLSPGALTRKTFELVSDDQVRAAAIHGRVIISAPTAIQGLLEVRGIGIVSVSALAQAELALIIDLVAGGVSERLPQPLAPALIAGISLPRIELDPREVSAPLKVALALANRRTDNC